MKDKIMFWYKSNLWTKKMVADAVAKGVISAADYAEITGEIYEEVA